MQKMIIVDDEKYIREGLKTVVDWSEFGITIIGEASNGTLAIEQVKRNKPDIILTDVRMPELDGLQLAEYISKYYPEISIVFVSAYNDFDYARKALDYGVKGYLLKPVNSDEVREVFKRVLDLVSKTVNESKEDTNDDNSLNTSQLIVDKAIQYINAHYEEKITLEEVAKYLFVSPNYLSSLFKKVSGSNFCDYLAFVRIQKSKSLLKKPGYKVKDISVKTGFTDYTYFCKVFKKIEGVTPLEFRTNLLR